ncbi:hypothetical protein CAPTEDRAFT_151808 [Capitella teleta]|uniref:Double zinc ribbon and ankyrin repeat-containing protein 1 n=1 Tax=Capitella teleta TaxID=283909 RepID=R7VBU3_CAPTE|nr:hypothetical protein CAPTEDRAFT_151808 [Capitella teleta]|eukprot:ELU16303.1 hypothetical protein CAPTEDRAFT_151808 [Capitella teleta]
MTAGAVVVPTIVPLRAPVPGQHKTCIDTNTRLELRSETAGATIYYTTNGGKPEPFLVHGPAAKSTFKYREPFCLPGGKRTVKALAVSDDGLRESHVMSKTFDVEQLETSPLRNQDDAINFVNDLPANEVMRKFASKMVTSKEAWNEVNRLKDTAAGQSSQERQEYQDGRHFCELLTRGFFFHPVELFTFQTNGLNGSPEFTSPLKRLPPDTATQTMRLQRETDFLKCVYCFAPRPSDPYARFCNECGNPVPAMPQNRLPPPEPGQMGTCVSCGSHVPFNTSSCLVCEAPIGPQNTPQASIKLTERRMCSMCGTANPCNLTTCVTCESRLPTVGTSIFHGLSPAPAPRDDGRLQSCTKCSRVNNPDARYCDWCGAKPLPTTSNLICAKCEANNNPYAKHCASCGAILEPPMRADARNGGVTLNMTSGQQTMQAQWTPVTLPATPTAKYDMATQTVGLFFPSQKEINAKDKEEEDKLAIERQMRDRKPLMTAISPGRGYWRKQMEHVCAHLKAYAANNPEFRALIGEPRMGKLTSGTVHEDGYELSLTVNFALRGTNDPFVGKPMGVSRDFLSSYTTGRKSSLKSYGSMESLSSAQSTARSGKKKSARKVKKTKKISKQTKTLEDDLTTEDKQLLQELGKGGSGSVEEVHQLIDEGADPSCVNRDGIPVLHLAVLNKHVDAIPVLVQEGADVNRKGPNRGNTALHEAVGLGTGGHEVVDVLLGCGANPQKKNDKNETAYDFAVKAGHETIVKKLAAKVGQSALDKLTKPRSSQTIDLF